MKEKCLLILMALLLISFGVFSTAMADDNGHRERKRYQKRERNHSENKSKRHLAPVNNATYRAHCGECHFVYQPELLPSGSWRLILTSFKDHFGETIELDSDLSKAIAEYLKTNSAEYSSSRLAAKIMESLGNVKPTRITQIPYIQREHHDIPPGTYERESIGSFSNCLACHGTAERGIYDDDYVVIPQ